MTHVLHRLTLVLLLATPGGSSFAAEMRVLDAGRYHLRSGTNAEWEEFANQHPFGGRLDFRFKAVANTGEQALLLWQDEVKQDWRIELNGRRLGSLFLMEEPLDLAIRVPPGLLRDGSNLLSILPPRQNDDIRVGHLRLLAESLESAHGSCRLAVTVLDADSGGQIPARLTITDTNGTLASLLAITNQSLAVRPGVVYAGTGQALLQLLPGTYRVSATRGFEYNLHATNILLAHGQRSAIVLKLRREVATPGLVSCDTHVHTFTHSRHGDATIEERAVTLAGEGIELPVLTDHDVAVDLHPAAVTTRTRPHFTPVTGDEVTTRVGHFNIFPVTPGASLPSNRETNWTTLLHAFRGTPGVKVVIFNHPRNIHAGFQPFADTHWNRVSGEPRWPFDFRVDAMELVNSSAQQSDWTTVLHDWFALWNSGHLITAVGSSDGHDVSRYIVGQGRTYIQCDDSKPDGLDVDSACRSLKAGRAYVSMGLLPVMTVDDRFHVGDLVTNVGATLDVKVQVLAPSWIQCERVELFANGIRIGETNLAAPRVAAGVAGTARWTLVRPKHDVFLVATATGPGNTSPHWPIPKPYQPVSPRWRSRVIGVVNPIRVDADGDGNFSTARDYATALLPAGDKPFPAPITDYDESVAIQAAALSRRRGLAVNVAELPRHWQRAFARVLAEDQGRTNALRRGTR